MVWLHSVETTIDAVTMYNGDVAMQAVRWFNYEENEFLVMEFPRVLATGTYRLLIEFHRPLAEDLRGYYKSSYVDTAGVKHWIATTQFESLAAFPALKSRPSRPTLPSPWCIRPSTWPCRICHKWGLLLCCGIVSRGRRFSLR